MMTIIALDKHEPAQERKVRSALEVWAGQGHLGPERSAVLAGIVRQHARRESWQGRLRTGLVGIVATAACCAMLVVASPAVRTWAADNVPVVGEYLQRWYSLEKGWQWAEQHQMFQEVMAMRTHAGYTFRVHRVLADASGTTIIYTVAGPDLTDGDGQVKLDPDRTHLDGKRFLRSWSSRSQIIDGVRVGSMELGALPGQSGTLRLAVGDIDGIQGDWSVSFAVTRAPLDDLTREIPVYQSLELAGGTLTIGHLTLTPLATVLDLEFHGPGPGPQLGIMWPVSLTADGAALLAKGASMSGRTHASDGSVTLLWTLEFDPAPEAVGDLVLRIDGHRREACEVQLPIDAGDAAVMLPDGNTVEIGEAAVTGEAGRALLVYTVTAEQGKRYQADPGDWLVIDNTGATHAVTPVGQNGSSVSKPVVGAVGGQPSQGEGTQAPVSIQRHLEISWRLPAGRHAVALLCQSYWVPVEGAGQMHIEVPSTNP
jgi:hypothetical protein